MRSAKGFSSLNGNREIESCQIGYVLLLFFVLNAIVAHLADTLFVYLAKVLHKGNAPALGGLQVAQQFLKVVDGDLFFVSLLLVDEVIDFLPVAVAVE